MFKKVLALSMALIMILSATAIFASCGKKDEALDGEGVKIATEVNNNVTLKADAAVSGKTINVGAIMVGDETEGYTEAHMRGINDAVAAMKAAGCTVNVTWEKKVEENEDCFTKATTLAKSCDIVISNSYGHQDFMARAAAANPTKTFVAMTGDFAAIATSDGTKITNLKNAFTEVYESRFVSGVVAGLKLKQLIADNKIEDKNKDADGNVKIGYIGAYPYAEVVSGYTAFFLGIKSVVSNISMEVQYTNKWFDFDKEYETAEALISTGCIIIGQHADSEGGPTACERAYKNGTRVYSVGYNVDMSKAAPHAALTSATNNWSVYYLYAFEQIALGNEIATDWAEGYDKGAVAITPINGTVFEADPSAEVKKVVDKIIDGSLKIFDVNSFTVGGKKITTNVVDFSYMSFATNPPTVVYAGEKLETLDGGAFVESKFRSAPYFSLRIDGIKEAN